jgi:hypothetical protein
MKAVMKTYGFPLPLAILLVFNQFPLDMVEIYLDSLIIIDCIKEKETQK